MSKISKVEGYESLVKDTQTQAVINTNKRDFLIAKQAKNKRIREKKEQEELSDKISSLTNETESLRKLVEQQSKIIESLIKPKSTTRRKTTTTKKVEDSNE